MVVIGCMSLNIAYLGRTNKLPIYVIRNGGPPLLGRDFMCAFELRLVSSLGYCNNVTDADSVVQSLTNAYPNVFSDELGCFTIFEIKLPVKSDVKPVFFKSRPVPFAIRDKVNNELDRLVGLGILKPVNYSEYASPIVPVLKRDGSIRICADYSVTINKQLLVEKYPLPTAQELFTKLHGGKEFSKLDLSMAYNQLKIHEGSQNLTCINTPRGLLNYTRLIFGLASAPSIFQRVIESIVGNMDGVLVFQDDVCITGTNKAEHMNRLKEVLKRLQEAGLTLRKDKCVFFQSEISYLGYIIDRNGIRKNPLKVDAIFDLLGPLCNKMFLVIVDAYSKWVECYVMNNNITTKAVLTKLSDFVSRFGIPNTIVTDNGTSFTSQEFANFCKLNAISHLFSPVYHEQWSSRILCKDY